MIRNFEVRSQYLLMVTILSRSLADLIEIQAGLGLHWDWRWDEMGWDPDYEDCDVDASA